MADEQDITVRTGGKQAPYVFGGGVGAHGVVPGRPESDSGSYMARVEISLEKYRPRQSTEWYIRVVEGDVREVCFPIYALPCVRSSPIDVLPKPEWYA